MALLCIDTSQQQDFYSIISAPWHVYTFPDGVLLPLLIFIQSKAVVFQNEKQLSTFPWLTAQIILTRVKSSWTFIFVVSFVFWWLCLVSVGLVGCCRLFMTSLIAGKQQAQAAAAGE